MDMEACCFAFAIIVLGLDRLNLGILRLSEYCSVRVILGGPFPLLDEASSACERPDASSSSRCGGSDCGAVDVMLESSGSGVGAVFASRCMLSQQQYYHSH